MRELHPGHGTRTAFVYPSCPPCREIHKISVEETFTPSLLLVIHRTLPCNMMVKVRSLPGTSENRTRLCNLSKNNASNITFPRVVHYVRFDMKGLVKEELH